MALDESHRALHPGHAHAAVPGFHAVELEHRVVDGLGAALHVHRRILVAHMVGEQRCVHRADVLGQLLPLVGLALLGLLAEHVAPVARDLLHAAQEGVVGLLHRRAPGHHAQRVDERGEQAQGQQAHVLVDRHPAVEFAHRGRHILAQRALHCAHGLGHVAVLAGHPLGAGGVVLELLALQLGHRQLGQLALDFHQLGLQGFAVSAEAVGVFRRPHALVEVAAQCGHEVLLEERLGVLTGQPRQSAVFLAGEERGQHAVLALGVELVVHAFAVHQRAPDALCHLLLGKLALAALGTLLEHGVVVGGEHLHELVFFLVQQVGVPHAGEVFVTGVAQLQPALVAHVFVEALQQATDLAYSLAVRSVRDVHQLGLVLQQLGHLGHVAVAEAGHVLHERVVVAARDSCASVQVALSLFACVLVAWVREELLGQGLSGLALAGRQDSLSWHGFCRQPLGQAVHTAPGLQNTCTFIQYSGDDLTGGAWLGQLTPVEGLKQGYSTLRILD